MLCNLRCPVPSFYFNLNRYILCGELKSCVVDALSTFFSPILDGINVAYLIFDVAIMHANRVEWMHALLRLGLSSSHYNRPFDHDLFDAVVNLSNDPDRFLSILFLGSHMGDG